MALLWFDGFESYDDDADALLVPKLNVSTLGLAAIGRRSSRGVTFWKYTNHYYRVEITENPSTIIVGFAFKITGAPAYASGNAFLQLFDAQGLITAGNVHVKFNINDSKLIEARNSAGTIIGTSSGHTIEISTWYYMEVKVTISDTVGQVTINVDEAEVLSTTADKDTCNGSNDYVGSVYFGPNDDGVSTTFIDDMYICDTSGDAPHNDFLGDVRIDCLRVSGAGSHTEFTPSAGSNYENVDEESGPDGDTTYNDGDTTNDEDSYALDNLPSPAATTIYGVKSQITARKTDAGARKCKIITRSGGTDYTGDEETLSDSFQTVTKLYEDNPDDSAAWEDADVNGMEVGIEVTA